MRPPTRTCPRPVGTVPARLVCLLSLAYLLSFRYSGLVNHGRLCFFFIVLDGTFFSIDDLYSIV
jgi:hypothetical protein